MTGKDAAIGFQIKSLCNLISRTIGEMTAQCDCSITGIQSFVIMYVYDHSQEGPVYQRDLERHLDVRRSTITEILNLMEKNGLIVRATAESDARQKVITLTPRAQALRLGIIERLDLLEARMRRGIPDKELELFFSVLKKIKCNLESPEVTEFEDRQNTV